jgi:hypothetical protein
VLLRLLTGLAKGLIIGGLIGYGLAAAGAGVPGALIAYPVAVLLGGLLALIAGKPIWAEGARIEVGTKAVAGAVFAPGLLWLARSFATVGIPFDLGALPGLASLSGQAATIGTFAVTSLAMVAALIGGFFDADNSPLDEAQQAALAGKQRIDVDLENADLEAELAAAEEAEAEAERRMSKKQ